ncbi:MAG: histidine phosphatase family protein [Aureispira sp.]|nr:histidine phosphatase family protein [Aureispira sp.]
MNTKLGLIFLVLVMLVLGACEDARDASSSPSNNGSKTLYLLRHAKSSHKEPSLVDFERPLKKKGMRDAAMMGEVLRKRGVEVDLILTSSAKRTKETVQFMTKEMAYSDKIDEEKEIYRCSPSTLLKIIGQLDDKYQSVMIVGHNPAMMEVTNQLGDTTLQKMPTCGLSAIKFETDSWAKAAKQKGDLVFYIYPKMFRDKKEEPTSDTSTEVGEDAAVEMEVTEEAVEEAPTAED